MMKMYCLGPSCSPSQPLDDCGSAMAGSRETSPTLMYQSKLSVEEEEHLLLWSSGLLVPALRCLRTEHYACTVFRWVKCGLVSC